ncbi:MAG: hypothetical protein AAF264_03390 [Pseudomonadota bacterium]
MTVPSLHAAWVMARLEWLDAIRDETEAGRVRRARSDRRRCVAVERLARTLPRNRSETALQLHVWWTEYGPPDDWPDPGAAFIATLWRTLTDREGDPRIDDHPQSTLE